MKHKILTTLGPSSLNSEVIKKLTDRGVSCFRINMSHVKIDDLKKNIELIQKYSATDICIDSEGAQVRTGTIQKGTIYKDRQRIYLTKVNNKQHGPNKIELWPSNVFSQLRPGDVLTVDFDSLLLSISSINEDYAIATVLNGGSVGTNKAVTLFPSITLPALSKKDIVAVKLGLEYGINNFALSFANSAKDVLALRKLTGDDAYIISKIESKNGVRNLDSILKVTDAILIDRGDLSREVSLENIPFLQKVIIKAAKRANKSVYVATNLLESMLKNSKPTRAEVSDVMNTLIDGASGLVLAAETAIGKYPLASVDMLKSLILRYKISNKYYNVPDLLKHDNLLLPSMHGQDKLQKGESDNFPLEYEKQNQTIEIDENTYLDVIQIAQGVYSPLKGFMNSIDLDSVLSNYKLSNGDIWTIPIILQITKEKWSILKPGMLVTLDFERNPDSKILLEIEELYKIDLDNIAKKWYGTNDINHPGVKRIMTLGPYVISGKIKHYNINKILNAPYYLTPQQTRMIFSIKGWSRIVAFHTRNIPHSAHEYLMNNAIKKANADGLLIQPVIGPKKKGDFLSNVILGAYDIFIESSFPGAILSTFSTYPRYSGPREAVFTALCRKNYGCTHFIVGRDHTGVKDYYKQISNRELFDSLGDIGIKIIYFDNVGFSKSMNKIVEINNSIKNMDIESISGTKIRDALLNGNSIPDRFIRKNVMDYLNKLISKGEPVFVE
tara:strand:- start:5 stop:2179 length:2175 start_codon:yes stop_codon:yes gene_type:complete